MDLGLSKKIRQLQLHLLIWYEQNGRNFPWRKKGLSDYEIIIAEILLQRTKAETIEKFFQTFLIQFPSWYSIDNCELEDLVKNLKPIGLHRQKAVRMKNLAHQLSFNKYQLPSEPEEIEKLSMFGQYIKNTVLLLIYNKPAPFIDVNMTRVLERYFEPRKLKDIRHDPYIQQLSYQVIFPKDSEKSEELNWAILDFAALVCKKRQPLCESCLLRNDCTYFNLKNE